MGGMGLSTYPRWFWPAVVAYLAVVAVTAIITGPTIVRGADGLEIMGLLLLGFPCSLLLAFVGRWGMLPFGDSAADWGGLIGLIAGSVVNVAIASNYYTSRSSHRTPRI
jgi:hypothetical protein